MINLLRIFEIVSTKKSIVFFLSGCLLMAGFQLKAQDPTSRFRSLGGGKASGSDTALKHRSSADDSITISFRFLDSSRLRKIDSSVYDFTKKFPTPWHYIDLGNSGTAAENLIFTPIIKSGWDEGLHAYDIYMLTTENTRFYNTTRPYTEMGYLVGSKSEQMIDINFTQNIKPNWNYAFEYRLINSPGTFNSQNTNHNNYRINSWYQSHNKRYQAFLIIVANKLASSENGGLVNWHSIDSNTLRTNLPTVLNNQSPGSNSIFSTTIYTGTKYSTATVMFRQQYDIIGKKDSIVTDSSVIPLFYPQFRAEHTISYNSYNYRFFDTRPDTSYYRATYGIIFPSPYIIQPGFASDTFYKQDKWKQLVNDLSLYQFPDPKNPQQFIKVGATIENYSGEFDSTNRSIYNVFIHGEYRNRTRNQKWDIEAYGKFYLSGYNAADYNASISLKRYISKEIGFLQVGFQNADRTPSFVFNRSSSFSYGTATFNKENITNLFGSIEQPKYHLKLSASYYLITNYAYFLADSKEDQQSALFNMLQVSAEKVFHLSKYWVWRAALQLQQKAGASPVNVPLLLTRDQIGYEGKLGLKNLNISFGLEFRYYTAYKADGYNPLAGQFFTQNDTTIRMHLPDITPYVNFRIRSFTAYVRVENLNTAQIGSNGFGFTNYNFVAPNYPNTGLRIRVGIFWGFVN
jgi:putative beta-barrel porin